MTTMEAVHCAREAWPEPGNFEAAGAPGEEEEQWAANPWQAQVDAHIMQLQQASGNRYGPVLGGSGAVTFGVPVLCSVALPSQAQQQSGVHVDVALQAAAAACAPAAAVACSPTVAMATSASTPAPAKDELVNRISDLEGHIALLEDTLMGKDKELEEMHHLRRQFSSADPDSLTEQPSGSNPTNLDWSELQRKNEFLSVLVTRFEKKTMDLEEEIVSLTLAKRDSAAEQRLLELESQVELLEEIAAQKDGELKELQEQLRISRERREDGVQQDSGLRAEVESLKERDAFLSGLVARFEEKTMKLERQVTELSAAKEEVEASAQQAAVDQDQLQVARAEAAELRDEKLRAQGQTEELLRAKSTAEELVEEHRQAAESNALALRECKKDHNAKAQDLLRRMQALEKQKRDLECENKHLKLSVESAADASTMATASEDQAKPVLEELRELKLLNAQLIERLSKERSEHAHTRQSLQMVSCENETLTCRLDGISEQLFGAVERNDNLQEELAKLTESIGDSRLTLRLESEDLHSMS